MLAQEFKKLYVREDQLHRVHVIGIVRYLDEDRRDYHWWHIHDDEEIPTEDGVTVALKPLGDGDVGENPNT